MIKIYGTIQSRTPRCLWALEEAGVAYELVPVNFLAGDAQTPEFLAVNPNGKVPALVDGDLRLCESMAINLYIARKYAPSLMPASLAEQAQVDQWSYWGVTELEPHLTTILVQKLFVPADQRQPAAIEQATASLERPLKVLDAHLHGQPYLVGTQFTIADLNVAAVLLTAKAIDFDLSGYQNVAKWLAACHDRPALQRAMAR